MQVVSCSDLRAPIRVVPALHLSPFPLAAVSPWRLDFGSVQVHGRLPVHRFLHVPGRLLQRFFGILLLFTWSISVPPGLATLTLELVSE